MCRLSPETGHAMDMLARALAHEREWLRRLASSVTPVRIGDEVVGELVLTATAPHVRDHNTVVLGPASRLDADSVRRLLDQQLGDRGCTHRRVHCTAADAARWHAGLVAHGYERTDTVVMRWPGGDLPVPGDVEVVQADRASTVAAVRTVLASQAEAREDVADELAELAGAQHDLGATVLVARQGGHPVGAVRVFPGDGIAQVEELEVLPDARRRGTGRSLLATALGVAAAHGLVFLTSDPDDWPTTWYERLGLQVVGRSSGFVRVPDTSEP